MHATVCGVHARDTAKVAVCWLPQFQLFALRLEREKNCSSDVLHGDGGE